jgi:putative ABC transport system ATP-binding protein
VAPHLHAESLSLAFGSGAERMSALNGVSVSFRPGTVTLVMGPSGSGKTTLLTVLGCLQSPDSGRVHLMGRDAAALSEDERARLRQQHVGYVYQAFRLFRALTALENVMMGLEVGGVTGTAARNRALAALDRVGLQGKAKLKPRELSGGEKQRVAIARATINAPDVILADEPTASLDHQSGIQIADMLRGLATKGATVVLVSHDSRLMTLVDRILVLQDGRLIEDRTP